jgi:excisionase family DNA binding protein
MRDSIVDGERMCITIPEAAKMLGLSRNFTYELARQHKLPTIKFGKRILIPRIQLEKMLEYKEDERPY